MTHFHRIATAAAAIVLAGFAFSSAFATDLPRRHAQVHPVKAPVVQPACTLLNGCMQLVIVGH